MAESQVMHSLSVLKNRSNVIYRLMFRNLDFPLVHDYTFLGLDVKHLTMSRTNISEVQTSSLRTLAHNLETLDLSYNNLKAVSYGYDCSLNIFFFSQVSCGSLLSTDAGLIIGYISAFNQHGIAYSGSSILQVPTAALEHLQNLSFLNLNYNMIKVLGQAVFSGLRALTRLSLYDNKMDTIEENAFVGMGECV